MVPQALRQQLLRRDSEQRHRHAEALCRKGAIDIANELGLPLVATSDAHYLRQEDAAAHDVLLCINTGQADRSDDGNRHARWQRSVLRPPPEEMYALFPGREEAVKRSQEIADAVHIDLDFKKRYFPVFAPPPANRRRSICANCASRACATLRRQPVAGGAERLEHELGIICRMGFASYFLIVWDFVRFALENGIPACGAAPAAGPW